MSLGLPIWPCVGVHLVCPGVGFSPPGVGLAHSLSLPHLWWVPSASKSRQADELGQEKGWGLHRRLRKGLV